MERNEYPEAPANAGQAEVQGSTAPDENDIGSFIYSKEDLDTVNSGTWVTGIEGAPPAWRLFVTGLQSKVAQKLLREKQAALRMKNRGRELSAEQLSQCTKEVLAAVVLKDWDGLTDRGQPIAYDKALARRWIETQEGEKGFTRVVLNAAQMVDDAGSDLVGEVSKN